MSLGSERNNNDEPKFYIVRNQRLESILREKQLKVSLK